MDFGAGKGRQAYTQRFPRGVCLGISPFNFPLNLAMHKIAPAVATGNTILIKPSPYTPYTLLKLEEWASEVGWPEGLFQVLPCSNEESEWLVKNEEIKLLSFTGSPKIGWMLKEKAKKKKVVLELGGNAAVLVDETADIPKVARTLAQGAYLYAGQICISTQRIYCVKEVREELQERLLQAIAKLQTGDPNVQGVSVGPLIDEVHFKRICEWVDEALAGGAELLCGGKGVEDKNLYEPTLLTNTKKTMKVVREEVFGPVAIFEEVESFDHGLAEINDSPFGLQAGVFTKRIDRMKKAFKELEVGGVIIDNIPGFRIDSMPYGGVKDSGHGREGLRYAMEDFTEERLLVF
jgi:glyceraldehyde-3-phosphate dehydrogenase (NADP+)